MKKSIVGLLFIIFTTTLFSQAPDWSWATQAGGSNGEFVHDIAIDIDRNCYVIGHFETKITFGSKNLKSVGDYDIYVAKMDENGKWLWATKAGGRYDDSGLNITIDNDGNIYVTGRFRGTATFGSATITSNEGDDIFVAKMDKKGKWLWASKAGGYYGGSFTGLVIDNNGNCYVTSNVVVAKLDANGNWLWTRYTEGSNINDIVIDNDGNSYIVGDFYDTINFDSYSLTSSGFNDIFVAKVDANGKWLWAKKTGGIDRESGSGIAIDDFKNCYVTGHFNGIVSFGSQTLKSSSDFNIFVAKMDENGKWLWASKVDGSEERYVKDIAIDNNGNCFVVGEFEKTIIFGSTYLISTGEYDIFVAKMDENGKWLWATNAGGGYRDFGNGIALDSYGNSYVVGKFEKRAIFGSTALTSKGVTDIFVAKLSRY